MGGGMRQAGVVSAPARVAVEETFLEGKLQGARERAKEIARRWEERGGRLLGPVETNMVWLDLEAAGWDAGGFVERGVDVGVKVIGGRLVVHYRESIPAFHFVDVYIHPPLASPLPPPSPPDPIPPTDPPHLRNLPRSHNPPNHPLRPHPRPPLQTALPPIPPRTKPQHQARSRRPYCASRRIKPQALLATDLFLYVYWCVCHKQQLCAFNTRVRFLGDESISLALLA